MQNSLLKLLLAFLMAMIPVFVLNAQDFDHEMYNQQRASEINAWLESDPAVAEIKGEGKELSELSSGERATRLLIDRLEAYLIDVTEVNTGLQIPRLNPSKPAQENLFILFSFALQTRGDLLVEPIYDVNSLNGMAETMLAIAQDHVGQALNRVQLGNVMVTRDFLISAFAAGYRTPEQLRQIPFGEHQVDGDGKQLTFQTMQRLMTRYGLSVDGGDGRVPGYLEFWDQRQINEPEPPRGELQMESIHEFLRSADDAVSVSIPIEMIELEMVENLDLSSFGRIPASDIDQEQLKAEIVKAFLEDPKLKSIALQARLKAVDGLENNNLRSKDLQSILRQLEFRYFEAVRTIRYQPDAEKRIRRAKRKVIAQRTVDAIEVLIRARAGESSYTHFHSIKDAVFREIAEGRIDVVEETIEPNTNFAVQVIQVFSEVMSEAQRGRLSGSTLEVLDRIKSMSENDLENSGKCTTAIKALAALTNRPPSAGQ